MSNIMFSTFSIDIFYTDSRERIHETTIKWGKENHEWFDIVFLTSSNLNAFYFMKNQVRFQNEVIFLVEFKIYRTE